MNFLKENRKFEFLYGGKPFFESDYTVEQTETENTLTTIYSLSDGLKVTNIAKKLDNAYEWVNYFENTSDKATDIISELFDCSINFPFDEAEPKYTGAYHVGFEERVGLYAPVGCNWCYNEFSCNPDTKLDNLYTGNLYLNETHHFAPDGGRSSDGTAPFFNIHKKGKGYICAVGWTGQWNCDVTRREYSVEFKTKIEDTHFRILPGEKFRTSSIVIMPYEASVIDSHNMWRRVVRKHFSLIGKEGRDQHGPLTVNVWGGMTSKSVIERVNTVKKYELPYEYLWMDAGWYGIDCIPSVDDYTETWEQHTGDWRVSKLIHPNGLKDVSAAAHEAGLKFLLWVEPERAMSYAPILKEHPEYYTLPDDPSYERCLLRLDDEEAWNYCYNTLANLISEIGIDCYRQDFNVRPLPYWRKNDAEDRQGITEIKHINGLYRLWDSLLERFPHLLIDNCASGGRRIDIETLRRSMPLWRSDYNCPANAVEEGTQSHHLSYNRWMPYTGASCGRLYDTYHIRTSYSPAMPTNFSFSEREPFGDDPEKMAWLKERLYEYLKVRPIMDGDFYPLTEVSDRKDIWVASQFDRPECNDGFIEIFRRQEAPYETASYSLYAIDENCEYTFTDADDNSEFTISGKELCEKGFFVTMKEKRSSKIYFYKKS